MDAYDEKLFKRISRPHGSLKFEDVNRGLKCFSKNYQGQLWIEIMLIKDINDNNESLNRYAEMLNNIKYDKLYLNTPIRPPAESDVKAVCHEKMKYAADFLGGISIDLLESHGFYSEIMDDYTAILSIIKRHPMNQFEIKGFLKTRDCNNVEMIINDLENDSDVVSVKYKGYITYRLK